MTFMWTFEGVMQAIGLGIAILYFLFLGVVLLIENIQQKLRKSRAREIEERILGK